MAPVFASMPGFLGSYLPFTCSTVKAAASVSVRKSVMSLVRSAWLGSSFQEAQNPEYVMVSRGGHICGRLVLRDVYCGAWRRSPSSARPLQL